MPFPVDLFTETGLRERSLRIPGVENKRFIKSLIFKDLIYARFLGTYELSLMQRQVRPALQGLLTNLSTGFVNKQKALSRQ